MRDTTAASVLSIVQMPPGVPVGSVGLDAAKNAALLAARILALSDEDLHARLEAWSRSRGRRRLSRRREGRLLTVPRVIAVDVDHPDPDVVSETAEALLVGEVVVFPTDTVYGVGTSVWHAEGVERLFPPQAPRPGQAVGRVRARACRRSGPGRGGGPRGPGGGGPALAGRTHRGPARRAGRSRLGEGEGGRIGLRAPADAFCRALLERTGPLAVTSANRSGDKPAATLEGALRSLPTPPDLAVDGGDLGEAGPSTVARWDGAGWTILRPGRLDPRPSGSRGDS